MIHEAFLLLIGDNKSLYCYSFFISLITIFFIIRKYTDSWLDPLRLTLVTVIFANAAPIFLILMDEMSSDKFLIFLFAELAFWLGFIIPAKRLSPLKKVTSITLSDKIIFNESIFLYFFLTLVSFIFAGIPLFADSRIGTFIDSGGLGLIARITPILLLYILIYIFHNIKENKISSYLLATLIAIFLLLSGSRSSLLIFVTCFYAYKKYIQGENIIDKNYLPYLLIPLLGSLLVFYINSNGDFIYSIFSFFIRLIATGDAYYMSFPNDNIYYVDVGNKFVFIFSQFLAPLRLISASDLPSPIGVQLVNNLIPSLEGLFVGPNSRPILVGYVLFGSLAFFYTFFIGLLSSLLIFRSYYFFHNNFVGRVFAFYLFLIGIRFIGDTTYGLASIFDFCLSILLFKFFGFLNLFFYQLKRK